MTIIYFYYIISWSSNLNDPMSKSPERPSSIPELTEARGHFNKANQILSTIPPASADTSVRTLAERVKAILEGDFPKEEFA